MPVAPRVEWEMGLPWYPLWLTSTKLTSRDLRGTCPILEADWLRGPEIAHFVSAEPQSIVFLKVRSCTSRALVLWKFQCGLSEALKVLEIFGPAIRILFRTPWEGQWLSWRQEYGLPAIPIWSGRNEAFPTPGVPLDFRELTELLAQGYSFKLRRRCSK